MHSDRQEACCNPSAPCAPKRASVFSSTALRRLGEDVAETSVVHCPFGTTGAGWGARKCARRQTAIGRVISAARGEERIRDLPIDTSLLREA